METKLRNVNRRWTAPVAYPKSDRNHPIGVLTSFRPGYVVPIAAIPMFREDSCVAKIRITTEMLETKELLMNPVTCRVTAWCSPFLADPRFNGSREELDRSYMGQESLQGNGVIPFVENDEMIDIADHEIFRAMGMHAEEGSQVNVGYVTHYNLIHNHRLMQRSIKLHDAEKRDLDDTSLAPAFWQHGGFEHMAASFSDAVIDGKVALDVVEAKMPIKGIIKHNTNYPVENQGGYESGGVYAVYPHSARISNAGSQDHVFSVRGTKATDGDPDIWAELQANGIQVSLANLELAKKLQSFARLRERYEGHDDDYIIDMLMQGLSIPDQHLKQPFNLYDRTVRFSQAKRYSTTAGQLDDSAVSGVAALDVRIRCPRVNTGGIIFVMVEVLPVQLWERQADWYLHSRPKAGRAAHDYWPDAERDFLDTQKVDVVYNGQIDTAHSDPDSYFAFEPMNAKYNRAGYRIGGKFLRPSADTVTDDARQRLYAVEGSDVAFTSDFMIAKGGIHIKPFLDDSSTAEPFETTAIGNAVLHGLTQFGGLLVESTNNYDKVAESVPTDKVDPNATEDA